MINGYGISVWQTAMNMLYFQSYYPVLFLFLFFPALMTYHGIFKSNTTSVTSEIGTAYFSGVFRATISFDVSSLVFLCSVLLNIACLFVPFLFLDIILSDVLWFIVSD